MSGALGRLQEIKRGSYVEYTQSLQYTSGQPVHPPIRGWVAEFGKTPSGISAALVYFDKSQSGAIWVAREYLIPVI